MRILHGPCPNRARTAPKLVQKTSAGRFHFGLVAAQLLGFIALPIGSSHGALFGRHAPTLNMGSLPRGPEHFTICIMSICNCH